MRGFASSVLSCQERERLEEELFEERMRGRNLSRLRPLAQWERKALEEREQAAQRRLRNHEVEHGCETVVLIAAVPVGIRDEETRDSSLRSE